MLRRGLHFIITFLLINTLHAALIEKLDHIHTLSAHFKQTVLSQSRVLNRSSGEMAFERPGKFYFHTQKPVEQRLIADGKSVWIYDPDLEQVIVKSQTKALRGTPALFLSEGGRAILDDYQVTEPKPNHFLLTAKSKQPAFAKIQFIFEGEKLTHIDLEDTLGQTTSIALQQVQQNLTLSQQKFQFQPPRGVDVIRE